MHNHTEPILSYELLRFVASELRDAKLKIKQLKAEKLKLLGLVAKKKKKGGKTKKAGLATSTFTHKI